MATSEAKIWVLGGKSPKADLSISWDAPFPNFADPDILIINLDTMDDRAVPGVVDKTKFQRAMVDINDKFMNGMGNIVLITSPRSSTDVQNKSQYDLSPVRFSTVPVQEGRNIKFDAGHPFAEYLRKVKSFNFYLDNFDISSEIPATLKRTKEDLELQKIPNHNATDNAGHILSIGYKIYANHAAEKYESSQLVLLPPCYDLPPNEAIDIIVDVFRNSAKEAPPEWLTEVPLEGLDQILEGIDELNAKKAEVEAQISFQEKKKLEIATHLRLLFTRGTQLEDAVYNAFKLLGFDDIQRVREKAKEDWVFKFVNSTRYEYGILEIKGADSRTTRGQLTQCSKWADEYFEMNNEVSKPIFVVNQHRSEKYPESVDKRKEFDNKELEYAKMKNICILPTFVLFETVNAYLKGVGKSRAYLEKKLAESSGLLDRL